MATDWEVHREKVIGTENMQGGLWFTTMGRIVLDNHNNEVFSAGHDKKLMTKEELTNGINFEEFMNRIARLIK